MVVVEVVAAAEVEVEVAADAVLIFDNSKMENSSFLIRGP